MIIKEVDLWYLQSNVWQSWHPDLHWWKHGRLSAYHLICSLPNGLRWCRNPSGKVRGSEQILLQKVGRPLAGQSALKVRHTRQRNHAEAGFSKSVHSALLIPVRNHFFLRQGGSVRNHSNENRNAQPEVFRSHVRHYQIHGKWWWHNWRKFLRNKRIWIRTSTIWLPCPSQCPRRRSWCKGWNWRVIHPDLILRKAQCRWSLRKVR